MKTNQSICSSTIKGTKTKRSICSLTIEEMKNNQSICSSTIEGTKTKRSIRSSTIDDLTLLVSAGITIRLYTITSRNSIRILRNPVRTLRNSSHTSRNSIRTFEIQSVHLKFSRYICSVLPGCLPLEFTCFWAP
jgi:hypothetical protein